MASDHDLEIDKAMVEQEGKDDDSLLTSTRFSLRSTPEDSWRLIDLETNRSGIERLNEQKNVADWRRI